MYSTSPGAAGSTAQLACRTLTLAHHVDDHRQRVLPVEFAEQSFDYVGVAELSHQMIVHFQQ